jgi:ribose/xylose/arabinose/galactoside ABC-type transport system permease subunit
MTESHLSSTPEPGTHLLPARGHWYDLLWQTRNLGVIVLFIIVVIASAASSPVFLTAENVQVFLVVFFVELALITMAQALVIMVRGIDLSVGGVIALTVISVGYFHKAQHLDIWLATGLGLLIGTGCGLLNGLFITRLRTPPIIVTLGSGIMFQGISLGVSGGKPYSVFPDGYQWIGQGFLGPIPVQVALLIIIAIIGHAVLSYTRWGRWVYAIGGNPIAARFSGIPVKRVLLVIYTLSGFLCAVAAIIMSARFNSAKSTFGTNVELMSITAALLGGVSIAGGDGSVVGALFGMLVIATLQNGMTLAGERIVVQLTLVAILLVVVVLGEQLLKERRIGG